MKIALQDLKLDQVSIIFPGDKTFKLAEKIEAIGLKLIYKIERKRALDIEIFSHIISISPQEIKSILEIQEFSEYFIDLKFFDDRSYITKCVTDFKLGKKLYKQKRMVDRDLWKMNYITISHEPNGPFKRDVLSELTNLFLAKNKISDSDVDYGAAIIFQENILSTKVRINIYTELVLKNGNKLKEENSISVNMIA